MYWRSLNGLWIMEVEIQSFKTSMIFLLGKVGHCGLVLLERPWLIWCMHWRSFKDLRLAETDVQGSVQKLFWLDDFFFNLFIIIPFVEVCHSDLVLTGPVRTVVAHVAVSNCPRVYGQQNDYTWMEKDWHTRVLTYIHIKLATVSLNPSGFNKNHSYYNIIMKVC